MSIQRSPIWPTVRTRAPSATRIGVPILLVASRGDRFVPYAAVEAYAALAPAARLETIEGDHFDIYAPPIAEAVAELEAAFLVEQLLGSGPPD